MADKEGVGLRCFLWSPPILPHKSPCASAPFDRAQDRLPPLPKGD